MDDTPRPARRTRPSLTARAVAFGRAVGVRGRVDPLADLALSPAERLTAQGLRRVASLPVGGVLAAVATGGLSVHATLRMAAVDMEVERAVEEGCAQVVVLGAGYDTRAWRLPILTGVPVVEVDLPAIQAAKRRALTDVTPLAALELVAADLAVDDLGQVLSGTALTPDTPTLWLWEAVAPYLPDRAVRRTAAAVAGVAAPASRLVMTYAAPVGGGGPVGIAVDALAGLAFTAIGEPLRSTYDDWDVIALLGEAGFSDVAVTSSREWAASTGLPRLRGPLEAERMAVART